MKIDIHVHTKKIKGGDAETRNITVDRFDEIIRTTDVKILAITNHNHFDVIQYNAFKNSVKDICQIWPGIELDVVEDGRRGHLIVIVNPINSLQFSTKVQDLIDGQTPDKFTISLKTVVDNFNDLDCIYIPHYLGKKPNLIEDDIEKLISYISNTKRVIKEASNSISAGIFISHGHNSIYGSDVHDWSMYAVNAKNLPELRLPVESFEQFCFLLEKDNATINTLLDKKNKNSITIYPFNTGITEPVELDIYNDINILFGSKGTGKSDILKALSKYYNSKGYKTYVYESTTLHIDSEYDIKGRDFDFDVSSCQIENCEEEIKFLKESTDKDVTSLIKYYQHFSIQETNKISQQIKIKNSIQLDISNPDRRLNTTKSILEDFRKFKNSLSTYSILESLVGQAQIDDLILALDKIIETLFIKVEENIFDTNSIKMLNGLIKLFSSEISKKTGQPPKPVKTGFSEYASNRIKIERSIKKMLLNLNKPIAPTIKYVGSLGKKGDLFIRTNVIFQNGTISDSNYTPVRNVKKTPQKLLASQLGLILKHVYSNELYQKISEMNDLEGVETINSLNDFLLFSRHFELGNKPYNPSNGESSMILLHRELMQDKDIYFIDEPEKSLGNDYINDVIVPLLKEKAQLGKVVVVATHDANIAVRTLPYNSIYRMYDLNKHYTFSGNPFSNNLKCIIEEKPDLDWKEISMKTLEGGREAFGERGKIYGN